MIRVVLSVRSNTENSLSVESRKLHASPPNSKRNGRRVQGCATKQNGSNSTEAPPPEWKCKLSEKVVGLRAALEAAEARLTDLAEKAAAFVMEYDTDRSDPECALPDLNADLLDSYHVLRECLASPDLTRVLAIRQAEQQVIAEARYIYDGCDPVFVDGLVVAIQALDALRDVEGEG